MTQNPTDVKITQSVPILGHLRLIDYYCTKKARKFLTFGPKTYQLVYYVQLKV